MSGAPTNLKLNTQAQKNIRVKITLSIIYLQDLNCCGYSTAGKLFPDQTLYIEPAGQFLVP